MSITIFYKTHSLNDLSVQDKVIEDIAETFGLRCSGAGLLFGKKVHTRDLSFEGPVLKPSERRSLKEKLSAFKANIQ